MKNKNKIENNFKNKMNIKSKYLKIKRQNTANSCRDCSYRVNNEVVVSLTSHFSMRSTKNKSDFHTYLFKKWVSQQRTSWRPRRDKTGWYLLQN